MPYSANNNKLAQRPGFTSDARYHFIANQYPNQKQTKIRKLLFCKKNQNSTITRVRSIVHRHDVPSGLTTCQSAFLVYSLNNFLVVWWSISIVSVFVPVDSIIFICLQVAYIFIDVWTVGTVSIMVPLSHLTFLIGLLNRKIYK